MQQENKRMPERAEMDAALEEILVEMKDGHRDTAPESHTGSVEVDERFREFFTETVAVIPEAAKVGGGVAMPEEQAEDAGRGGFFSRLARLFRREDAEEADEDAVIMVPGVPVAAPIPLKKEPVKTDTVDLTQQFDLALMGERKPQPEAEELTGEIHLEPLPEKEPETVPQKATEKAAEKNEELLEELLKEFSGEKAEKVPPQPEKNIWELPLEGTERAAMETERPVVKKPEDVALLTTEQPTGEIAFDEEPTGEIALFGEQSTGENTFAEEPTGEITLPEQPAGENAFDEEPTGEIALFDEQPTGEISLFEAEPEQAAEKNGFAAQRLPEGEEPPAPEKRASRVTAAFDRVKLFGTEEAAELPQEDTEPPQEQPEAMEKPMVGEYDTPEAAQTVAENLSNTVSRLTLRSTLLGILAAALLALPLSPLDAELTPVPYLVVQLLLLTVAAVLSRGILRDGLCGLVAKPSADTMPALAVVAALVQLAVALAFGTAFDPKKITLFAAVAVLLLFADTLGARLMAAVIAGNFDLVSGEVEHSAAYRLRDTKLAAQLAAGMEEKEPVILLSRPAALVKDFMAQSFSARRSEEKAQKMARILLAAAVVCAGAALVLSGNALTAATVLAGVLCMGAPLSTTLVSAVPSLLMQKAASRVGAVVPGWCCVEQLGKVDLVQVDARELFVPACAKLFGIKTFRKERLDYAILYATSIIIEGCNTLEGLFRTMIENHTEMLYEVKDLHRLPRLGFTAWCDNCRVVLGTRELMRQEDIPLPPLDLENRYSKDGQRQVMYLAVSGQLYAMFLLGYNGERKIAKGIATLRKANARLLVRAEDPTLTAERIEKAYHLEPGFVKVLSGEECAALEPATAYLPESEGCMVHLGSFASFVGGMRAAAGAAEAEQGACAIQFVSVLFSVALCLFLSVTGGMAGLSLLAVVLYQVAWSALTVALPLTKKY